MEAAVLGSQAELEAAGEGMSLGAELDYAARLTGKVGYQFAEALVYGTAGVAYAEFGTTGDISGESGDETCYAYGIGMDYRLTTPSRSGPSMCVTASMTSAISTAWTASSPPPPCGSPITSEGTPTGPLERGRYVRAVSHLGGISG